MNNQNSNGNYGQNNPYTYRYGDSTNSTGANMQGRYGAYGAYMPPQKTEQPQAPQQSTAKPQRKSKKFVKGAAMLMACAMVGFGGGAAAISLMGGGTSGDGTVVYRAAESAQPVNDTTANTVSSVAQLAGASVVAISTENLVSDYMMGSGIAQGAGSGVIISEDGYIITNNHVVEGASNVVVTLPDETQHSAQVIGRDAATDIAVIKIDASGLTPAVFANSDEVQVGEFCLAIGNSNGTLSGSVTDGIVSGLNREIQLDEYTMTLMQTNAAVSPGNSGGGLFNSKGELIGVVNSKSGGTDVEGIGFAIPSNTALSVSTEIMQNGSVVGGPGLGVTVISIQDAQQAQAYGISALGLYIMHVNSLGAAQSAGLEAGDRLVSIDGTQLMTSEDLSAALQNYEVGDTVALEIERAGETLSIQLQLAELVQNT